MTSSPTLDSVQYEMKFKSTIFNRDYVIVRGTDLFGCKYDLVRHRNGVHRTENVYRRRDEVEWLNGFFTSRNLTAALSFMNVTQKCGGHVDTRFTEFCYTLCLLEWFVEFYFRIWVDHILKRHGVQLESTNRPCEDGFVLASLILETWLRNPYILAPVRYYISTRSRGEVTIKQERLGLHICKMLTSQSY